MTVNLVQEYAKSKGYDRAVFLKTWNGYQCYEPVAKGDGISFVGLPLVILVKGKQSACQHLKKP